MNKLLIWATVLKATEPFESLHTEVLAVPE